MPIAPELFSVIDEALTLGCMTDATTWKSALSADRDDPHALTLLARIYAHEGDSLGGIALLGEALRLQTSIEKSHRYRAEIFRSMGEHERAASDYAAVLLAGPTDPSTIRAYIDQIIIVEKFADAVALMQKLVVREPRSALCINLVGAMLQLEEKCAESIPYHERAMAIDPNNADYTNNLGTALRRLGKFTEAEKHLRRATQLEPKHFMAWYNLGNVLRSTRRLEEAVAVYEESIVHNSEYPESHFGLACTLLQLNQWERGWKEFEWRWKSAKIVPPITCELPLWDGKNPQGKRIMVVTEQGSGDTLQCVRYTKQLVDLGAIVTIWAPKETAALLRRLPHITAVATFRSEMPASDYYIPMMSLPRIFSSTSASIPTAPYIVFGHQRATEFAHMLGPRKERLRLGIAWAGNPIQGDDHLRSAQLTDFTKLFTMNDIRWIGVQKGPRSVDIATSGFAIEDWSEHLHSFDDTASLFANLDGLLCVCTGPVHLAGAMGMQAICMLSYSGDWRWCTDEHRTQWYPNMRLVRQPQQGDWDTVATKSLAIIKNWKQTSIIPAISA